MKDVDFNLEYMRILGMDIEYVISNICDHFAFQENYSDARNYAIDFVIDYFRKYGMKAESLSNLIEAINALYRFCKSENEK